MTAIRIEEEDAIPIPDVPHKLFTLVLVRDYANGRVLLGEKLRGFGTGYFNGFGGKVEAGETVEAAALRELKEEANIDALDLTPRGVLRFIFDDNPQPWLVHVFHASKFEGDIQASDEMRPAWFGVNDVPFKQMWADDEHWYPLFMAEETFVGTFTFTQTTTLVKFHLRTTDDLSTPESESDEEESDGESDRASLSESIDSEPESEAASKSETALKSRDIGLDTPEMPQLKRTRRDVADQSAHPRASGIRACSV